MTAIDATTGLPLQHFLAPLSAADPYPSVGEDRAGHEAITTLPPAVIDTWMSEVAHNHPDMEAKTRAAYLIGHIAWTFGINLGAMRVAGHGLPDIDAAALAAAPQWYHWEEGEESGESLRFTLRLLASPDAAHRALDADGIRALVVAAHAPLIEALFAMTQLGRSAMWRLVADGVAASWLSVGKRVGREAEAMRDANAIIHAPGSPLANKQISFVEIVVRDETQQPMACEWFRARGGCCRYYTTEKSAGEYCTTCVLRPAESRDQRLQDYVMDKLRTSA